MAVSRRLRFEILRRDGHTCRYCGASAPDVALTVDHVIPTTLGGGDEPNNLVAACEDCNAGKSSVPADAALVEDVAADALRWARAIEHARVELDAERQVIDGLLARFRDAWDGWTYEVEVVVPAAPQALTGNPFIDHWHAVMGWVGNSSEPVFYEDGVLTVHAKRGWTADVRKVATADRWSAITGESVTSVVVVVVAEVQPPPTPPRPTKTRERRSVDLPAGWEDSIERFLGAGLPIDELERLIAVAMRGPAKTSGTFRYFCGCAWRAVTDLQESARRIIEMEEDHGPH